jgi:hypothetical protein
MTPGSGSVAIVDPGASWAVTPDGDPRTATNLIQEDPYMVVAQ